jgi:hypothetical protein
MKNKYRNRKTNQVVYSDFILDKDKFEPIVMVKNGAMKNEEIIQKGHKNNKESKDEYAKRSKKRGH